MFKLTYQLRVNLWMQSCFGAKIAADKEERNARFLEEALELVQATGMTKEDVLKLVDYTFNRPIGEPFQELGGVSVTLAALCNAQGLNVVEASEAELARITDPVIMEKIRAKQEGKKSILSPSPEE